MRKTLRLAALAALFVGGTLGGFAQTELNGSLTGDPSFDYSTQPITFSLTAVANALETDTATLAGHVRTYLLDETTSSPLTVTLVYNAGEKTYDGIANSTTNAHGGFWMDANGDNVGYGDNARWYTDISVDGTNDALTFHTGQFPNRANDGGVYKAEYRFALNGKYVAFHLTYTINKGKEYSIEKQLSKLTILKDLEVTTTQKPRSTYTADRIALDTQEVFEGLGLAGTEFAANIRQFIHAQIYDETNELWKDSISNTFTANAPGFWFLQLPDETTGSLLPQCYSKYNATSSRFFAEMSTTQDGDTLFFNIGQNPGVAEKNSQYWAYVYIVNGTNAYRVKVTLNTTENEAIDFSDMTLAAEQTVSYTITSDDTGETALTLDQAGIAALLGIEPSEMSMYAYQSEGVLTNASTANNGGYWFNKDGFVCSYGDANAAMYIEPASTTNFSTLNTGKFTKTVVAAGDSCVASVVFLGTDKYVQINVVMKIAAEELPGEVVEQADWKVVEVQEYTAQVIPSQGYSQTEGGSTYNMKLNLQSILQALGAETVGKNYVYTWKTGGDNSNEWIPENLDNNYTCTPYPGFWMSADGRTNSGWAATCAYGICFIASGSNLTENVQFFFHPGNTELTAGSSVTGDFFLVNPVNGKVVDIRINVLYVDARVETKVAGTEQVLINLTEDALTDEGYAKAITLDNAFKALGITEDEYLSAQWKLQTASGMWMNATVNEIESVWLNESGYSVPSDSPNALFSVFFNEDENTISLAFISDPEAEKVYKTNVGLEYDGKIYAFNILASASNEALENAVGINAPKSNENSGAIYDLSGRRVQVKSLDGLAKGIYIQNGKKIYVK
jgi:hypothetical protein